MPSNKDQETNASELIEFHYLSIGHVLVNWFRKDVTGVTDGCIL